MSIEVGSKWVKDGEVVEVLHIGETFLEYKKDNMFSFKNCVSFKDKIKAIHILTDSDFLEQYKPYEPVYEYEWIILEAKTMTFKCKFQEFATDEEMEWHIDNYRHHVYVKIVETKRERK